MSYHRGGHSGAVAVSYSTMSPLSPIRRYSGSAGSGTSVTSSTNGTTNSAYSNYRSTTPSNPGNERNGGYYTSASNVGHRSSSFGLSRPPETSRRVSYSPARSVSSYNESSSIVGSSSISASGLRYGSVSSSSASSSAGSSNSSCTSRERNTLQHHTSGSSATTAADLYALYSPVHYIPNISGSTLKSSNGSSPNWRSSSLASSSGISSSLHGGDEYDSCRERRERSYSSETSSGVCFSSNNTSTSSTNQNFVGSNNDRWTTRRDVNKRRGGTPLISTSPGSGSNNLISANANNTDIGSSTIEVTLEPEESSRKSITHRDNELPVVTINVALDCEKNEAILNPEINRTTSLDSNPEPRERFVYNARNNDNRDLDNNNTESECKYVIESRNSNDHTDANDECNTLETRCRRRRLDATRETLVQTNLPSSYEPRYVRLDDDDDDDDEDHDVNRGQNNSETVEPHNRDNSDDSNVRERGIIKENTRESYRVKDHHHQRKRHSEQTSTNEVNNRKNDLIIPPLTSRNDNSSNNDSIRSSRPLSSSVASLAPLSTTSFISQPPEGTPFINKPAVSSLLTQNVEPENREKQAKSSQPLNCCSSLRKRENIGKLENFEISVDSNDCDVDKVGGGDCGDTGGVIVVVGSSADADNHRKAFTRTKIPTNNDNTELLTNNNVQDREGHLGIVETARQIGNQARVGLPNETRLRDRQMVKGARKSLIWTATNPVDDDDAVSNEDNNVLTNGDESQADTINGFDKSNNHDNSTDSRGYDADENAEISAFATNGLGSTGNRADDVEKASDSRRTLFAWNDPTIDDLTGASSSSTSIAATASSSSSAATSSSNATNSVPVAVHQNIYRGTNDQIDENSRPPRSRLQFRKDERYGLNGLRNIGNTCFMNSVIQCLSNTRPLLEYLLNEQHLQDINTTTSSMKGALIKAFGQVIQELWEMSGDHVVNTTALKSQIQRFAPRFMGYSQQDAQEFLRYLLEGLHEDVNRVTVKPQPILTDIPDHYSDSHKASESWKRYLRSEDSTIVDVFVGQLRSSLLCTACDHVSVTLDPFWDLSLPIPMRLGTVKLNQCLEHFTKVETLDGDEKPTCSKCQMRRKCTKSFSIQKFPKILVIHLKRFSPTERFRGKLSVLVDFPLTGLDLSAFAAPGVQGCTYNLYGVANHSGTTYSGHYTAYCKHPYSGEWHEYNDSRVSSVPARSVVSSEAYVLFYEQQPPSPHL